MVTSPKAAESRKDIMRQSMAKDENRQSLVDYKLDDGNRASLRKSLATKRPNQWID